MAGETQITVTGNVVDENAELRFTSGGAAVAKFRIASTPRTFDRQTNSWKDSEPLFLTVNVWRQQAEQVAETLSKGMRVVVVGVLKSRSYEKDGAKRTVFEVEAEDVAVSLKFATAKVTRAQRQDGHAGSQRQPSRNDDAWASNAPQQGGGWGAPQAGGYSETPPF